MGYGHGRPWWLHNCVNVFNATELCTQKWLKSYILCYVYFTTIKIKIIRTKAEQRGREGVSKILSFCKGENDTENCFCL